jgi:TrmH family RNA methyltransferase
MSEIRQGRVEEITSHSNPRIKSIRALAMKKARDRDGLFIAEGLKLSTDALAAGWEITTLVHPKRALEDDNLRGRIEPLSATIRARGGDILTVPDKLMVALTKRDNPQVVLSVIRQKETATTDVPSGNETWLCLEKVRDPGNLGTCFRTAEALGIAQVLLVGDTTDPFALETVRATMGAFFHVPFARLSNEQLTQLAKGFRTNGGNVTGAHLEGSEDHRALDYSVGPQLLVMGNEQAGLTSEASAACDRLARIPMAGEADSLNLAVATGILTFAARNHAL